MFTSSRRPLASLALLVAACVWGVAWYPYRLLAEAGLTGSQSSLLTYAVALAIMLAISPPRRPWSSANRPLLLAVALAAGWTNLAYVLAVIQGEIMRVMLLFYLAPLWTVLFARLILAEKAGAWGWLVIVMAMLGAVVMLYDLDGGLPFPANMAEWLGLSAGFTFALSNVLARKLKQVPTERRSVWIFAGVLLIALLPVAGEGDLAARLAALTGFDWTLVVLTGGLAGPGDLFGAIRPGPYPGQPGHRHPTHRTGGGGVFQLVLGRRGDGRPGVAGRCADRCGQPDFRQNGQ